MKVLKVIFALIISFALLCSQGLLMAAFSCDKSFSADSVTKAIQETDFTQQLYDQALAQSNQAADEKVQEFLQSALKTDKASELIGDYASSAIGSILYGKEYSQFTKEDLNNLASDSLDELEKASGGLMTEAQKQQAMDYVNANGDQLVKEINDTLPVLESAAGVSSDEMAAISQVQKMLGAPVRAAMAAACLILGIILIALFWRSKLGFVWWAMVSFITGGVFVLLGSSSSLLTSYIQDSGEGTTFSSLLTGMFSHGFLFVGIAALAFAVLLLVICLISRKVSARA